MKVLIVGSGGREHAIAYSVAKSDKVDKIYCTPGNAGIAEFAECEPIGAMEFDKIVAFAKEKRLIWLLLEWMIHWLAVWWMNWKPQVSVLSDLKECSDP